MYAARSAGFEDLHGLLDELVRYDSEWYWRGQRLEISWYNPCKIYLNMTIISRVLTKC